MSDFENYETTFNHFFLHFLRDLCNFCPNTCSQEAKLMKGSHLGVVTLGELYTWGTSQFEAVPIESAQLTRTTWWRFVCGIQWWCVCGIWAQDFKLDS
jgi:hypothetical protein